MINLNIPQEQVISINPIFIQNQMYYFYTKLQNV